jgi:hypothetical protein
MTSSSSSWRGFIMIILKFNDVIILILPHLKLFEDPNQGPRPQAPASWMLSSARRRATWWTTDGLVYV